MAVIDDVKAVLGDVLQLGDRVQSFDASTLVFGSIPELDSMAVVALVTALEERFNLTLDDDEITAELFESVGSLTDFIEHKQTLSGAA